MTDLIPPFENTPVEAIATTVKKLRAAFNSQVTKPLEFRLQQLRKLYWGLEDNADAILQACKQDMNKSAHETYMAELDFLKNEILYHCKNLAKWIKDEPIQDVGFSNMLMSPKIRKDPLGAVLVIGAYNFPVNVAIGPLIGAISAGNTAVLKPSEQAPCVAMVLQKVMSVLDPSCFACVQGGVPETTELLDQKWDKIFYTGGAVVGKIIARKAAETLTPVALELGGRNPAIVTRNADLRLAARRLLWAKCLNAGQVCISQNYILVDREVQPALVRELRAAMAEFFPNGAQNSPDLSHIATARQWHRLKGILDGTKGKILLGGTMDEASRFLEPTVVDISDAADPLIAEETFGPIISLFSVDDLDHALRVASEVDDTPLSAYAFGTKAETDRVLRELRSGGASINDGLFHASIPTAPFGGVGQSGQGSYRGKASFDCFTHRRSITYTPGWIESMLAVRYPPYTADKTKQMKKMNAKPNFDREGRVKVALADYIFSGKTVGVGAILLLAAGVKQYLDRRAKL